MIRLRLAMVWLQSIGFVVGVPVVMATLMRWALFTDPPQTLVAVIRGEMGWLIDLLRRIW